jgi:hypothetical protein
VSLQNGYTTPPLAGYRVSITRLSSSEVVTANINYSGDYIVQAWTIDSSGVPTPAGSYLGGAADAAAIAAVNSGQVLVATRDSAGNLKVIAFAVGGGRVTRQGSEVAGAIGAVAIGANLGSNDAFTPVLDSSGNLEIIYWGVSNSGVVSRVATVETGVMPASAPAACRMSDGWPITVFAQHTDGLTTLAVGLWLTGAAAVDTSMLVNDTVSVAAEGNDSTHGYFITGALNGLGNSTVGVWSMANERW